MALQNYTIFANQSQIRLIRSGKKFPLKILVPKVRQALYTLISEGEKQRIIQVESPSPDVLFKLLKKSFKTVYAAGGLLVQDHQLLHIRRNGKWDLPKGKLEKNERPEHAAAREVAEECGIAMPKVNTLAATTTHVYPENHQLVLKHTFWYYMTPAEKATTLSPQTEEGITECAFLPMTHLLNENVDTHASLRHMLRHLGPKWL
jgi:ADP-ribose pyrophosphatase YjhB (NUDIX family)